eukprot:PITA_27629
MNSYFFHKQAQARKCTNSISEIKDGSIIHKDNANIQKAASLHFKTLYSEDIILDQNSNMMDVVPSLIYVEMNHLLEAKVTKNEVKDALFAMDPDKAPRPDGFSARFLQICWPIVEKDLYKMVLKSQVCQKIGGNTNSAFLALIPKEKGANSFNRFRLISLYNIRYKLITKVIANKLKPILPKIVPELRRLHPRAADFFKATRALRQGCPLSPLLFVLQASVLSFYLDKKRADQDIAGLCIARGVKNINHALFVDDTLYMASRFKRALDEFCMVSGSSLNNGKCHIYCWNTTSSLLNSISRNFGFAASSNWTSFK